MANNLSRFWQELKRRKVLKVVAMYAGGAYVLIELAGNVSGPLNFPDWIPRTLIILALAGFPLVAILSWIFDITPEGIRKTESLSEEQLEDIPEIHSRRSLKVSDVIILLLAVAVCILLYPKIFNHDRFMDIRDDDRRISVVVMPFQNLTADTTFNIWQSGLQNLLITSLSNSEGLSIRQEQVVNAAMGREGLMNYSSMEPSFPREIALRLNAGTVITGNMYQVGEHYRITANLMNSRNGEMYQSFEVNGSEEDDFFSVVDEMACQIKDFLEIESLEKKVPVELKDAYTSSAEAYKDYLMGRSYHGLLDYNSAIESYTKAVSIDSNFVLPMLYLTYIMGDLGRTEESRVWAGKAYERVNKVPTEIQLHIKQVKAMVDKDPYEQIKFISTYLQMFPYSTQQYYTLGWVYYNTGQWENAIEAFEDGLKVKEQIGKSYKLWIYYYTLLGRAYSETGEYEEAIEAFDAGLDVWPGDPQIINWKAISAISFRDSSTADTCITALKNTARSKGWPDAELASWIASCYDSGGEPSKAEELYSVAIELYPDHPDIRSNYARFLIKNDINVEKGIELIQPLLSGHPDSYEYMFIYGSGLYKKGAYKDAIEILQKAWNLRPTYDHEHFQLLAELEMKGSGRELTSSGEGN